MKEYLGTDGIPLSRMEMSILLALYKNDPVGMTKEEIEQFVYAEGLLLMTDDEFEEYWRTLIRWKNG